MKEKFQIGDTIKFRVKHYSGVRYCRFEVVKLNNFLFTVGSNPHNSKMLLTEKNYNLYSAMVSVGFKVKRRGALGAERKSLKYIQRHNFI